MGLGDQMVSTWTLNLKPVGSRSHGLCRRDISFLLQCLPPANIMIEVGDKKGGGGEGEGGGGDVRKPA